MCTAPHGNGNVDASEQSTVVEISLTALPDHLLLLVLKLSTTNMRCVIGQVSTELFHLSCDSSLWSYLTFDDCKRKAKRITDAQLEALLHRVNAVTSVEVLSIRHCVNVRGTSLAALRGSTKLVGLDLRRSPAHELPSSEDADFVVDSVIAPTMLVPDARLSFVYMASLDHPDPTARLHHAVRQSTRRRWMAAQSKCYRCRGVLLQSEPETDSVPHVLVRQCGVCERAHCASCITGHPCGRWYTCACGHSICPTCVTERWHSSEATGGHGEWVSCRCCRADCCPVCRAHGRLRRCSSCQSRCCLGCLAADGDCSRCVAARHAENSGDWDGGAGPWDHHDIGV